MPVIVNEEVLLNVEKAQQEADELRKTIAEKIKAGMKEGSEKSAAEIKAMSDKVAKEMERVAKAAEKAFSMELVEQYARGVKLLVKDIDVLNERLGKTIEKAVEFGEVGGKIGGIWGAIIGAGIGVLESENDRIVEKEKARLQEAVDFQISVYQGANETLAKILVARQKKGEELAKKQAEAERKAAEKAAEYWSKAKIGIFDGVASVVDSVVGGVKDTVDAGTKELDRLKAAAKEAQAEIAAAGGARNERTIEAGAAGRAKQGDVLGGANAGSQAAKDAQTAAIKSQAEAWNDTSKAIVDAQFAAMEFYGPTITGMDTLKASAKDTAASIAQDFANAFASVAVAAGEANAAGAKGMQAWGQAVKAARPEIYKTLSGELIGLGFKLGAESFGAYADGNIPSGTLFAAGSAAAFAGAGALGFRGGQLGAKAAGGRGAAASGGSSASPSLGKAAGQSTVTQGTTIVYLGGGPGSTTIYAGSSERGKAEAYNVIESWKRSHAAQGAGGF